MKKLIIIIILLFCSSGCVTDWNRTDKILLGSLVAGQAIDITQTERVMSGEYMDLRERNPMMKSMDIMIPAKIVVVGATTWLADRYPKHRRMILWIGNAVTWGVVGWNYRQMR